MERRRRKQRDGLWAGDISDILHQSKMTEKHKYQVSNVYIYEWESDWFSIDTNGLAYEIEIKVVRNDFHLDFRKRAKHIVLQNVLESGSSSRRTCPNVFYYCSQPNIIFPEDIPPYAGLLHVVDDEIVIVKKAPVLHRNKDKMHDLLLDKFYYQNRKMRQRCIELKQTIEAYESESFRKNLCQAMNRRVADDMNPIII